MSWAVVKFLGDEEEVEVIPTSWIINNNECWWPTFSKAKLEKAIRTCSVLPDESWTKFKIKIFSKNETKFTVATAKATKALYASNVSDAEIPNDNTKRVIKKKQFINYTQHSDESNASSECVVNLPRFPQMSENATIDFDNIIVDIINDPNPIEVDLEQVTAQDRNLKFKSEVVGLLIKNNTLLKEQNKVIDDLNVKINYIIEKLSTNNSNTEIMHTENLEEVFNGLPITNQEEMTILELKLESKDFTSYLVTALARLGGENYKDVVRRIMKKVITDDVAKSYSWQGHKGKLKFCSTKLAIAILEAVKKFDKSNKATIKDIETAVAIWLTKATERIKTKSEKERVIIMGKNQTDNE
ncbi:hypothetical protein FQR65_LT08584 [Abscondita terminalis]|nr:hypothetical protein FQR65_LT08584 [Abscondita terminalis]